MYVQYVLLYINNTNEVDRILGLNIFYFKRKWIANKHKAYEWLSRKKKKKKKTKKHTKNIHTPSFTFNIVYLIS